MLRLLARLSYILIAGLFGVVAFASIVWGLRASRAHANVVYDPRPVVVQPVVQAIGTTDPCPPVVTPGRGGSTGTPGRGGSTGTPYGFTGAIFGRIFISQANGSVAPACGASIALRYQPVDSSVPVVLTDTTGRTEKDPEDTLPYYFIQLKGAKAGITGTLDVSYTKNGVPTPMPSSVVTFTAEDDGRLEFNVFDTDAYIEHAPPLISAIVTPTTIVAGLGNVSFQVSAVPQDDRARIVAYEWTSDFDGWLGSGASLLLRSEDLLPVTHTITVRAWDSLGGWSEPSQIQLVILPPLHDIIHVAAGPFHTCAAIASGGVKCWGNNGGGQLGDGTTTNHLTPVDVQNLASTANALAAGNNHTCVVLSGGGVKCWGNNGTGELGDGTTAAHLTPVDVQNLNSTVTALASGDSHTCAVLSSGGVKCWGWNAYGQLGDGTTTDSRVIPVDVQNLAGTVSAFAAGVSHTCAAMAGGGVKCWGRNFDGELGDGTTTYRLTPINVQNLAGTASALVAGSEYTCAALAGGGVKCWGSNGVGQLGDGMTTTRLTPVDVQNLTGTVSALAAGSGHTCAALAGGGVKCWGNNAFGQLGDGTTTTRLTPVDVQNLTGTVSVLAAGDSHTCAVLSGGGVRCWGWNAHRQLGDGTATTRLTPVDVQNLSGAITMLVAGGNHTCAVLVGGGVKCWGYNGAGQLGDGTTLARFAPVDVQNLVGTVSVLAAGDNTGHTCAALVGVGVKCWGYNGGGQLGDGTTLARFAPVDVRNLTGTVSVLAAGDGHTCAALAGGGVKCWGYNNTGQIGNGTDSGIHEPVNVVESAEPTKSWTYMLYLAGDNDLDEDWLFHTLENLTKFAPHPNVNIVVQYDRSNPFPGTTRYVFRIGKDNQVETRVFPLEERNSGDPQTLSNFVAWAHDTFPAEHYYLAIANHGRGMAGLGWDDTDLTGKLRRGFDWLNPTSLRNALRTATNGGTWQIDVLHFDACLIGQLEDAYQVKDYARYVVASQNLGWSVFAYDDYANLVPREVSGTIKPHELAVKIADRYFEHPGLRGKPRTIAVYDMIQVGHLREAVDGLAQALSTTIHSQANITPTIEALRDATQHFDSWGDGRIDPHDDEVVDLYDLTSRLSTSFSSTAAITTAAQNVMDIISPTFVIKERHASGVYAGLDATGSRITATWGLSDSHGVGIFFPPAPGSYDYQRYVITRNLFLMSDEGQWDDFLRGYFTLANIPTTTRHTLEQEIPALVPKPLLKPGLISEKFLPMLQKPPQPDLVASLSLSPSGTNFISGEPMTVTVVITNIGNATADQFYMDFYVNPSVTPTVNVLWDQACGAQPCPLGLTWWVPAGLAPGQSVTLTSIAPSYVVTYSRWYSWLPAGSTDVYVLVDSFGGASSLGAVAESDETNNLSGIHGLTVSGITPPTPKTAQNRTPASEAMPARKLK